MTKCCILLSHYWQSMRALFWIMQLGEFLKRYYTFEKSIAQILFKPPVNKTLISGSICERWSLVKSGKMLTLNNGEVCADSWSFTKRVCRMTSPVDIFTPFYPWTYRRMFLYTISQRYPFLADCTWAIFLGHRCVFSPTNHTLSRPLVNDLFCCAGNRLCYVHAQTFWVKERWQ